MDEVAKHVQKIMDLPPREILIQKVKKVWVLDHTSPRPWSDKSIKYWRIRNHAKIISLKEELQKIFPGLFTNNDGFNISNIVYISWKFYFLMKVREESCYVNEKGEKISYTSKNPEVQGEKVCTKFSTLIRSEAFLK